MNSIFRLRQGFLVLAAAALIGGCGGYGSSYDSSSGSSNKVVSIAVTPGSATISTTGSQQFNANPKNNYGNTVSNVMITWHSSDTSVATIDANGLATAVGAGTTKITATAPSYSSGMYSSTTVTSNEATLTVSGSGLISGIAQAKAPLGNQVVQLRDASGQTVTVLTDAEGHFSLSTGGLTPPYLLLGQDAEGRDWYSLATGDGTANINPATDWMTRQWFRSQATSPVRVFADELPLRDLSPAQLSGMDRALVAMLAPSLDAAGVAPPDFSFQGYRSGDDRTALRGLLGRLRTSADTDGATLADPMTGLRIVGRLDQGQWWLESRGSRGELLHREAFLPATAVGGGSQ